jgi:hypothetical protein
MKASDGEKGAFGTLLSRLTRGASDAIGRVALDALGILNSPMGYEPLQQVEEHVTNPFGISQGALKGTCILRIGKWCTATNLLLQNSSFEVSKECDPLGVPLFAQGSIQLQSNKLLSYDEYQKWFTLR